MKQNLMVICLFSMLLLIVAVCGAQDGFGDDDLDAPDNLRLTSTMDSITATWDREFDADEYVVSWGTVSGNPDNHKSVPDQGAEDEISTTLEGLQEGTTYYVEVVSKDGAEESDPVTGQIQTKADTEAPATPTGFGVTSLSDITETTVKLKWNDNNEDDFASYEITVRATTTSTTPVIDLATRTVTDLTPSTRYYFSIVAVDKKENKSSPSPELIVDTLPDELAPLTPESVTATLSGDREVTVKLKSGNEGMADFTGIFLYYGQNPESLELKINLQTGLSHIFTDLPENTTWYFAATAYDFSGNESALSPAASLLIEKTETFLDRAGDADGGCFIDTLFEPEAYDVTENKNKVGVSAGYYLPAESDFEDFYGKDTYPVFLFYERGLSRHLSVDLKAGFMKVSGNLLTVSGASTEVDSDFTLAPVSASVNLNFPLIPYIWGFVGVGPDYWYYDEESDLSATGNHDWVGGYHGRTGLWLYNRDPDYKNWGGLVEIDYSKIDRFGGNDADLGGWLFLLGAFYSF